MRILKRVDIERKHKCQFCRSIFAYKEEDVNRKFDDTVVCPACQKVISVSVFDRKVKENK
jgi:hypothetical protein